MLNFANTDMYLPVTGYNQAYQNNCYNLPVSSMAASCIFQGQSINYGGYSPMIMQGQCNGLLGLNSGLSVANNNNDFGLFFQKLLSLLIPLLSQKSTNTTSVVSATPANSVETETVEINKKLQGDSPADSMTTALHRSFNSKSKHHLYTTNEAQEQSAIASYGYKDEGVTGYISPTKVDGVTALYGAFNPKNGDYLYTTNKEEAKSAVKYGYNEKEITGYISPTEIDGTTALYRLLNPKKGDHFYTTNEAEAKSAVSYGYIEQGIVGYIAKGD